MNKTSFTTNPIALSQLLQDAHKGTLQLPDFQRSWVWDEDRIISLIASVSRGFPVGALMTLKTQPTGASKFAHRLVQGAPDSHQHVHPAELLLDGQQRITSLYQTCMRDRVVTTITPKKKVVKRWFYIDIRKALNPDIEREEAIVSVPEDRKIKSDFDRVIDLDLSTPELEYRHMVFPLNRVLDQNTWLQGFWAYWNGQNQPENVQLFFRFQNEVLANISGYQIPVISLAADTSHEAVCLVFEKVNTGGKALDAFELLTAMYAARGHKLRDDWLGREASAGQAALTGIQRELAVFGRIGGEASGVLSGVSSTDFLQSIVLLHARERRLEAMRNPKKAESDWPAVRANRAALLELPLEAYQKYKDAVLAGYKKVGQFLLQAHIYRVLDLPYQSQLVPMAALFAILEGQADHAAHMQKLRRWFWCGVFGELYGSAAESRFARDVMEVPAWLLDGGPEPGTVKEGLLRPERLLTMRTRLSAAYKGIHALLMSQHATDFLSGTPFGQSVFFDEAVDIHHIFPKAWCERQKLPVAEYDCVVNKTPLAARTNRIIGGVAPSAYLRRLQDGQTDAQGRVVVPPIAPTDLDGYLASHAIPVEQLRGDDFAGFMQKRQRNLLALICAATGHALPVQQQAEVAEEGEELSEALARDAGIAYPDAG